MARRQSQKTRRARAQARQQHIASGNRPRLQQDWECPICSRWFSRRRNGPQNHLRSHKLTESTTHPTHCLPHRLSSVQPASLTDSNSNSTKNSDIDIDIAIYQDLTTSESSDSDETADLDESLVSLKTRHAQHLRLNTDLVPYDDNTCK